MIIKILKNIFRRKIELPDIYEGNLNARRIHKYQQITQRYNIQEGFVRDIFCEGAEWYKNVVDYELNKK